MKQKEKTVSVVITSCYDQYSYNSNPLCSQKILLTYRTLGASYSVKQGEPEDMTFDRDLEDVESIKNMIILAHKAGKEGVELSFEEVTEK